MRQPSGKKPDTPSTTFDQKVGHVEAASMPRPPAPAAAPRFSHHPDGIVTD